MRDRESNFRHLIGDISSAIWISCALWIMETGGAGSRSPSVQWRTELSHLKVLLRHAIAPTQLSLAEAAAADGGMTSQQKCEN